MVTLKQTLLIAKLAHGGQRFKAGKPSWTHCKRVADRLKWFSADFRIVALLHEVLDDTRITIEWLKDFGYSDVIIEAIKIISHKYSPSGLSNRKWQQYILSTENELAIAVMYANLLDECSPLIIDTEHNGDISAVKSSADIIKLYDYVSKFKDKYKFLSNITKGDLEKREKPPEAIIEKPMPVMSGIIFPKLRTNIFSTPTGGNSFMDMFKLYTGEANIDSSQV